MKKIIFLFLVFSFSIFLSGCTLDQTTKITEVKQYPSGIFKTINNGQIWDSKSFVEKTENRIVSISDSLVYNIDFSPVNNDMVVSTRNNGVYYSKTKGENWKPLFNIGKNVKAFSFGYNNDETFYVGYNNKLYRTDNYGADWKVIYEDPDSTIVNIRADYTRSSNIYIFFADGRVLKTEDGSSFKVIYNFSNRPAAPEKVKHDYTVDKANPLGIRDVYFYEKGTNNFYVITNDGGLYFTGNGGTDFIEIDLTKSKIAGNVSFLTFYPGAVDSFILVTDNGIYKTFNRGEDFEAIDILTNKNKNITALAISPRNANVIYYALGDLIYRTSNGGQTWNTMPSPVTRNISTLKIDPENSNAIYLGSDVNLRMVEDASNKSLFCDLFGILFSQLCKTTN